MKRFIALLAFIIITFVYPLSSWGAPVVDNSEVTIVLQQEEDLLPPPHITANGSVVIEQATGRVLHGTNEHKKLYPASTTKVLTALIAIELGNLEDVVIVGNEVWMIPSDSSLAGINMNERISLHDLILGLMINSGNDAANTIAVHIARSQTTEELSTLDALKTFSIMMNDKAIEVGATNSNFVNPHGYHHSDHYTTAYDLAMIARAGMEYEFFRQAVSTLFMQTTYLSGKPRYWRSKNRLIDRNNIDFYEFATGMKTGWTSASGSCLISSASKNDLDLIAVVLNSQTGQQWNNSRNLLEYGFSNYQYHTLFHQGAIVETLPVDNYASDDWGSLMIEIAAEDAQELFHKSDIPQIKQTITWNDQIVLQVKEGDINTRPRLKAPITKGDTIGYMEYTLHGQVITKTPLIASRDVRMKTFLYNIPLLVEKSTSYSKPIIIIAAIVLIIFIILKLIVITINRRRRRRYIYRR